MSLLEAINWLGEGVVLALGSLIIGVAFGVLAQRSRFCMRAAVIELSTGSIGTSVSIWMLAFFAAIAATQGLIAADFLEVSQARQLAARGSLSGAIIGGLLFGGGMVLARGCASRLLVLSATGNLRALVSGLVLTVTAQASLRGALSPLREYMSNLWTVDGGDTRSLMTVLDLDGNSALVIGVTGLVIALFYTFRNKVSPFRAAGALGIGLMIAIAWLFTYSLSYQSFEPVPVMSISLIGPSADTLMTLINKPAIPLDFNMGLVPGIFLGSLIAALLSRTMRMECFDDQRRMPRYIGGAILMGFGGMLAGGCAVGASVTGNSVFSMTALAALGAMWFGAALTDYLVDRKRILIISLPDLPQPQPQNTGK